MTTNEIFLKFSKWSPEHAEMVVSFRQWGSRSLYVKLRNGMQYKVKCVTDTDFVMQTVSDEDVKKKFGGEC